MDDSVDLSALEGKKTYVGVEWGTEGALATLWDNPGEGRVEAHCFINGYGHLVITTDPEHVA